MVFVSEQIRPYRIAQIQDVAEAHIIVTSEGPFDAIDGDFLSFRHTHWDDGFRDVWGRALTQASRGNHQACPFPLRDPISMSVFSTSNAPEGTLAGTSLRAPMKSADSSPYLCTCVMHEYRLNVN